MAAPSRARSASLRSRAALLAASRRRLADGAHVAAPFERARLVGRQFELGPGFVMDVQRQTTIRADLHANELPLRLAAQGRTPSSTANAAGCASCTSRRQ